MADTTRITVTLPTEYVEELRKLTDNMSAYVAEAVAYRIRHQLREAEFRRYEDEHGAFTEDETAAAYALLTAARGSEGRTESAA
ncbi:MULTISPECIES: type II toxin-antitoxin system CcdA family antitoxin [unclassified Streptomyces]|uniref:type II toxin-antitoxin system CcdA family antitoxin n=1 Tax=unclassified Streptomyces TaxID=2593676 RepID=UPI000EF77AFB|nr:MULTISPECIES: type II toxin-antitoxin system CcdA family antitoxin [unclassified Streptomyces]MZE53404.1 hypothetical protein [Streptomyces sp. SID5770]